MEFLNDMALFVEVVKVMSFRKASEAMGIPNSTLSRRISALEKNIGLRLLHRTTRKIELTEAGQIYYERCRRIVDEARIAHEQLGEMLAQPSGMLRVSLPVDFSVTYLSPLIAEFSHQYPGITFDFDLTPRRVDLITEPFDLAIRMGDLPNSHLIARPLAYLSVHVYASPRYIELYGEPKHPSDLVSHSCLSFPKANKWMLWNESEKVEIEVEGRFLVNSNGLLRRFSTLDLGIVMLPTEIAADDLLTGQLRRILPEWQGTPIAAYALTETRLLPAKTQRFIDFLQERLTNKPICK
ncbi:LysR family transcriptional regulator [Acinetobacter calcoaceticus]|uniref:LysR family transcriptional regulator n=1 Tax=Acinetobacter calcoaceticus TaxID=471 RepID=UPI0005828032|nr:LysR family transcriptional regulator [Acinetobacter calcoaceticus]GAM29776.1 transcriptional regulator, LysR family [Acinetobacter calcoaceticus]